MNDNNKVNTVSSGGTGFLGLLQIVFIILKLCNVIDWSWMAVLIPTWISIGIVVIMIIILFIINKIIKDL